MGLLAKIKLGTFLLVVTLIGVAYSAEKYVDWRAEHQWQRPVKWVGFVKKIERPITQEIQVVEAVEDVKQDTKKSTGRSWKGRVSWYGHGADCTGCDPNEIMANGQKFDENAMTLAFNYLPMNTRVRVKNLDNGANTIATVTDTGGFEEYGRIADLSKGLMQELNATTDKSTILIEVLE
jgi:rare lipoprotein A (peptidoglycan hydrolase)